jgi:hypothetical protein
MERLPSFYHVKSATRPIYNTWYADLFFSGVPMASLLAETNGEMDPQLYLERGC